MVASSSSWMIFLSRTWTEVGMKSGTFPFMFWNSYRQTITRKIEIVINRQSRKIQTRQIITLRGKFLQNHRIDQRRPQVLMGLFRDIALLSAVHVARRRRFEPLTVRCALAGLSSCV
jgi:aspartate carbamoyltransferase regulatory subunit